MTQLTKRQKLAVLMSVLVLVHNIRARVAREIDSLEKNLYRYEFTYYPQLPINVSWDIDDLKFAIYFRIQVEMEEDDVIGVGFSNYGDIKSADLALFWSDSDTGPHLQDTHTDEEEIIQSDEQQDYKLTTVDVKRDKVIIEFERNYETDDDNDYFIDRGTTHVIAFLERKSRMMEKGMKLKQEDITLNRVQLLKSQLPEPELPTDVQVLHVHVNQVEVPLDETTYWCSLQQLPYFESKLHIVRFEGAISEETQGIVHHLEVFHCQVEAHVILPPYEAPCSSKSERPLGLESCTKVLGAWAMGAKGISYPDEAGAPIGGKRFSQYIMLEIHYNNPQHIPGLIDNSGIKFFITDKLRKYDSGVMEIGLEYTDKMAIPPGLKKWKLNGYCVSKCTEIALPEKGIYVFASQLHAHLTGTKIYTKHYRDGVELPELNRDNHYSPHFQEIRRLHEVVRLMPGDEIVNTCVDRTTERKNVTLGGFSIYDEMCVNYIHYYPITDLEVCKSSIATRLVYEIFSFFKRIHNEPIDVGKGISYNYQIISWNDEKIQDLKTFYDSSPLSVQCNRSDGERFPGTWEPYPIPMEVNNTKQEG